ncbi:hypothetical protein G6F59_018425 [Rhizopus arrhizus]|nr:hypothetical protein G6F59_018425 [Rhizopus arrhizus]
MEQVGRQHDHAAAQPAPSAKPRRRPRRAGLCPHREPLFRERRLHGRRPVDPRRPQAARHPRPHRARPLRRLHARAHRVGPAPRLAGS